MIALRRERGSAVLELALLLPVLVPLLVGLLHLAEASLEPLERRELARLAAFALVAQPRAAAGASVAAATTARGAARRLATELTCERARGWPVAAGGVARSWVEVDEGPGPAPDGTVAPPSSAALASGFRLLASLGLEPLELAARWQRELGLTSGELVVARAAPRDGGGSESVALLAGTTRVESGVAALPRRAGSTSPAWAAAITAARHAVVRALPAGSWLGALAAEATRLPPEATAFFGLPPLATADRLVSRPCAGPGLSQPGAPGPGQIDVFALTGAHAGAGVVTLFDTLPFHDAPERGSPTPLAAAFRRRGPWSEGCPRPARPGCAP